MFRANVRTFLARFCISNFSLSVLCKPGFVFFVVGLSVSEASSLVESQLCDIVFSNELFGVVRLYSTALYIPSGFQ